MNDCHKIMAADGRVIAEVYGATRGRSVNSRHAESQANARLIAAAPDLLSMLESTWVILGLYIDGCAPAGSALREIYAKAEATIARAEGK